MINSNQQFIELPVVYDCSGEKPHNEVMNISQIIRFFRNESYPNVTSLKLAHYEGIFNIKLPYEEVKKKLGQIDVTKIV